MLVFQMAHIDMYDRGCWYSELPNLNENLCFYPGVLVGAHPHEHAGTQRYHLWMKYDFFYPVRLDCTQLMLLN